MISKRSESSSGSSGGAPGAKLMTAQEALQRQGHQQDAQPRSYRVDRVQQHGEQHEGNALQKTFN